MVSILLTTACVLYVGLLDGMYARESHPIVFLQLFIVIIIISIIFFIEN